MGNIKFITQFKSAGFCDIDLELLIRQWSEHCNISAWSDSISTKYTLYEDIWIHGKRTQRYKFKIQISPADALALIERLKLNREQSSILKSGSTYRIARSEQQYVYDTMRKYIERANKEIKSLRKEIKECQ